MQDMQVESMMFRQKQQMYFMQCKQQTKRNASVTAHNSQLLEVWHKAGGPAPNLLLLDLDTVPVPSPPENPATRRAVEQAAAKEAQAEAAQQVEAQQKADKDKVAREQLIASASPASHQYVTLQGPIQPGPLHMSWSW